MDCTFPTIGLHTRLRYPLSILLILTTFLTNSKAQTANCASQSQAPWQEWIGRVQLSTLDNASEKTRADRYVIGYSDWTDKSTTLTRGQNYPLSITPAFSWSGYQTNLFFRVWIDFNGNNIFEDSEKILEQNAVSQLVMSNVTIPTTAVLGAKKMRVSMKKDAYATACETFAAGEVEDYSVNIADNTTSSCANNVLNFDGVDDYLQTKVPVIAANSDFTMEASFTSTATGSGCSGNFKRLLCLNIANSNNRLEIGDCNSQLTLFYAISGGGSRLINIPNATTLRDGNWHHVAAVKQGDALRIYYDGALVLTELGMTNVNNVPRVLYVGRWGLQGENWSGNVDEVRVWNYAVSAADINTRRLCQLAGNETGLTLYYPFNQGVSGGNNVGVDSVINKSSTPIGTFMQNFGLSGATSNWICSTQSLTQGCTTTDPCVNDITPPVFSNCPANINLTTTGTTAVATWTPPTATDNCGTPSVSNGYPSGFAFPIGTTVVNYTAIDGKNNRTTCSFNVVVTAVACGQTTKGSTLNITNNSATIKWQRVATAINYTYELRNNLPGGSGSTGLIASGTVTDTFVNLNSIGGGRYQVFVRVNCSGGGASNWSLPISFTTLEVPCTQGALTTLNEQFEGTTQGFLPLCWRNNTYRERWDVEANVDVRTTGRGTINNDTKRAIMYRSTSTDSVIIMAVTPELSNVGAGTHRLRFKAANTWTNFSAGSGRIQIGTSSNAFDPSTFTPFGAPTVIMDNTFREYTIDFANYRGSDRRIAFKYVDSGGDGSFSSIEFDDVVWEQNPVTNPCANDVTPPVFTLIPSDLTINCPTDLPVAAPVTATDNCTANVRIFLNEVRFSAALVTRTWTATDAAGNSASITQRINIVTTNDGIPPVFSNCPANITLQQTGALTIVNWTPPTVTDNCGTPSVSSTFNAGSGFPVGTTTVVHTARDGFSNTSICSFTVTINGITNPCDTDRQRPIFTFCPANINLITTGTSAVATWANPVATDNCGTPTITSSYASGNSFPIGTTFVAYNAADAKNNGATCIFNVTVVRQIDTSGNVCANPTANIVGGANSITVSGITTSAAVIQIFTSNWSLVDARQVSSSTATIPNIPAGTYNVKVTVLNAGGVWPQVCNVQGSAVVTNGSNPCANDVTPPVFSNCPSNINLTTTGTTAIGTWPVVLATDNCTAQPTISTNFVQGWSFPIGTTTVIYTAKDASNNTSTCSFTVTVTPISSCGQPTKGLATAITDTSVVVKWQRVPSATNYTYELRTNNAPSSSTIGFVKSGTTTDTFVRITYGLTGRYQVFIKANCSAGASEWSKPISFTTLEVPCNQGALTELNENFENTIGNVGFLPLCWRNNTVRERWDVETNVDVRPVGRGTNNNNTKRAVMYRSTSTDSVIIMAVTPELSNVGAGTHRLRFKAANTWGTPYAGVGKIQIGTSSNPFDPSTFTPFGAPTTLLDNIFKEYTIDFANYRGTDRYIAFKYVDGGGDGAFRSLEFDDVIWERTPVGTATNDVSIGISSPQSSYRQWTPITISVSAKNTGTTPMTNVKIELKRPDKTASGGAKTPSVGTFNDYCAGGIECSEWTIPSLAVGATATLDAPFFVLDATQPIVATAKLLSSTPTDNGLANNLATVSIPSQTGLVAPNPAQLAYQKPTQLIPIVVQRIAPNPTEGDLIVKLESLDKREVVFNFYNTLGKLVKSETKTVEKGINRLEFSVYELEQGVHFIVPTTTQGHKVPTKFVKM